MHKIANRHRSDSRPQKCQAVKNGANKKASTNAANAASCINVCIAIPLTEVYTGAAK